MCVRPDHFVDKTTCPQHVPVNISGGGMRTKEDLMNTGEEVPICTVNAGGKMLNPISFEEQVVQGARNRVKVRIAYVKNDESTTVDIDKQLEIPPAKVIFLVKPIYTIRIGMGVMKSVLNFTTCLVRTRVRPNSKNMDQ